MWRSENDEQILGQMLGPKMDQPFMTIMKLKTFRWSVKMENMSRFILKLDVE